MYPGWWFSRRHRQWRRNNRFPDLPVFQPLLRSGHHENRGFPVQVDQCRQGRPRAVTIEAPADTEDRRAGHRHALGLGRVRGGGGHPGGGGEHEHVHLGVAVSVPDGLLVPVIREADMLSVKGLHDKTVETVVAARDGTLALDLLSGSTFSVSNMGMFGVEQFTAIINPGESGILAVSSVTPEVRVTARLKDATRVSCPGRAMDSPI